MSILALLSILIALFWLLATVDGLRGLRTIGELPEDRLLPKEPPLVSVILTAKEEEDSIRDTVRHLLDQDYPRLEIIAINDRSRDGTGTRLDELRRWSEGKRELEINLRVIHITALPEGWLGKNHALYQGYLQSRGSYLLFTDADVRFHRSAIRKAVAYALGGGIDHLTLSPYLRARSYALRSFIHFFLFAFSLAVRPWRSNDDNSRRQGMGIGAFNLVSRTAYEAIGTHAALKLRADDDLELGNRLKRSGSRQRLLSAYRLLEVEWYRSLKEAVHGFEKNMFAGFRYSTLLALLGCLGLGLIFIVPVLGLLLAPNLYLKLIFAASLLAQGYLYARCVKALSPYSASDVWMLPWNALLMMGVIVRTVVLTLKQGGMYWRGTFYSLRDLKRMRE
ncbi:glycosyltransferase [Paenibacillus chartarius]|uniref:4,4'-diaponeurosporenoate glycosyltransferase n=1 Tax=Paenibacillus chartarius TaxID=747481 RepID=A0ABV6DM46_9BACL